MIPMRTTAFKVLPWLTLSLCVIISPWARGTILLHDVTQESGIGFIHTDGSCGQRYIVESVSAGLALLDSDRDGDVDIYFPNGAPLKGTEVDTPPQNRLYRNELCTGKWPHHQCVCTHSYLHSIYQSVGV